MTDISKIDKNFALKSEITGGVFVNVDEKPFTVYGVDKDENGYGRVEEYVAKNTNDGVYVLSKQTAGGLVRFKTDSKNITLRANDLVCGGVMPHMTALGSNGFDMFSGKQFIGSFPPPLPLENSYTSMRAIELNNCKPDENGFVDVTVYMPLYGAYKNVEIMVDEGAKVIEGDKFINEKPVVFYGSSITQGGCASNPGMGYTNIVSRDLNLYCKNLGFSGSARGETIMAEYIASIEMSALVLDYDHNAPNIDHLRKTHMPFYKIIREKNPDLPIIFASAVCFKNYPNWNMRREIIKETYETAKSNGDNVYFLNGEEFFDEIPFDYCTVDACHPNSLGMYLMAKAFEKPLTEIFGIK